jgi:uncharacterized membrane-anchored protein YjiN (DUF445 family)
MSLRLDTLPGGVADTAQREADLRRMKRTATGCLVLAGVVYLLTTWALERGAASGWEFLQSAAEAGLVGGLADWFAVTALFRHPLGIPVPHTAIIPRKKDQLGASLSTFVGENFLVPATVRSRLARFDVAAVSGRWLAQPEHAERAGDELARLARGAITVLRDEDVQRSLEFTLLQKAATADVSRPLGRVLRQVVDDGAHTGLVDLIVGSTWQWLHDNGATVQRVVAGRAPGWSPKFVDQAVAQRVYAEIMRVVTEVRDDPHHEIRQTVDRLLLDLARDMQRDPETIARVQRTKDALLTHPRTREILDDLWASARVILTDLVSDPDSGLRRQTVEQVQALGARLESDEALRTKVNGWVADAASNVIERYRDEVTAVISETVQGWDAAETSRRIEVQVGRDLQFIRINGFVVGALAGTVIHGLTVLIF